MNYLNKKRKDYREYEDRLVISDSSPLIALNSANKLDFLKNLFAEVYTTKDVKDECGFNLPSWIKIEEPIESLKTVLEKRLDKGERSAVALILQLEAKSNSTINAKKMSLILDDGEAVKKINKMKLKIEKICLVEILSFAYDKNLCNKVELKNILDMMKKNCGRDFKKSDIVYLFGENKNWGGKKV